MQAYFITLVHLFYSISKYALVMLDRKTQLKYSKTNKNPDKKQKTQYQTADFGVAFEFFGVYTPILTQCPGMINIIIQSSVHTLKLTLFLALCARE